MQVDISKGIDVAGLHFEVAIDGVDLKGWQHYGECSTIGQRISIEGGISQERLNATFLHEILEAIDTEFELELQHHVISCLDAGLAQVFKSLGIEFVVGDASGTNTQTASK